MHWSLSLVCNHQLESLANQLPLGYTYAIDCYRREGSEVSQVFNFWRQELGMTFAFYTIYFAEKIGYQWVFFFFACMGSILGFLPILMLMFRGKPIREYYGHPKDINQFDHDEKAARDESPD